MRLLTVVAPGGAERQAAASAALVAWNRGLDIRLRFLNIGVEEVVLVLAADDGAPEEGLAAVEEAIRRREPDAVLLHGGGNPALAAAVSASKAGIPVVRTAAGSRPEPGGEAERATDRLCAALLADGPEERGTLSGEGLSGEPWSPEAAVRALVRVVRAP